MLMGQEFYFILDRSLSLALTYSDHRVYLYFSALAFSPGVLMNFYAFYIFFGVLIFCGFGYSIYILVKNVDDFLCNIDDFLC